jgi:hypothetical protein
MGWYFSRQTRDQLISELVESRESERARSMVIAYSLRGNVLWSVVRATAKQADVLGLAVGESMQFIRCDLLQRSGDSWGYKPMDESAHPYYYSCPLSYLEMAPVQSAEWRDGVRAYHEQRRVRRAHRAPVIVRRQGEL